jgi:GNAT superfamily N-acetyltransferase
VDVDLSNPEIRRATAEDVPAIIALASRSLGWNGDDEDERFFRWKHFENPWGQSPMWVATAGERVIGFRTFLRWQFSRTDGTHLQAVRAVDTATDPDHQGRGVFSRLTLHGIEELRDEGVGMIFNTPNAKSLPGYLKMGWHVVGRPPVCVMPTSVWSLWQLSGARTAASRSPIEMRVGEAPEDVFSDVDAVSRLSSRIDTRAGLATTRTPEYLRWRYGFAPLRYRVMLQSSSPADGLAVFHLRRRGRAIEATVCDVMTPSTAPHVEHQLMKKIATLTNADYLLRSNRRRWIRGFLPVPKSGPVLTFRSIDGRSIPTMADLALTMGDVELF